MRTSIRVGGYALGLAAIFGAALGVGGAVGPAERPRPAGHGSGGHRPATTGPDGATSAGSGTSASGALPGGLQVAEAGYRLSPITTALTTGPGEPLRFQIIGPNGAPVTDYTPTHDRDLHLIVVRRDLSGFQHLHPELAGDGTWSVPVAVAAAGQYRIFADFQPAARTEPLTLGVDLPAAGVYEPRPLPEPARTATVDGYTVTLAGELRPGTASTLTLRVTRDGTPVTDLQPYLAAYGHLVALRDGDLAYLHVHPDGTPGDGRTAAGPEITFHTEVPSSGSYRLFLDFQHAGTVRTAAFTVRAADASGTSATPAPVAPIAPATPATPGPAGPTGTDEPAPDPSGGHDTGHTHN